MIFPEFVVSRNYRSVVRTCPFCKGWIQDGNEGEINFIVHLGLRTKEHQERKDWADYIRRLNFRGY